MEKIKLLKKVFKKLEGKRIYHSLISHYNKAILSEDYERASQIILGEYMAFELMEVIDIPIEELQKILGVNVGIKLYENGKIEESTTYQNGKKNGEHLKYYKSGKISEKSFYKDDKLHGEKTNYSEDGEVRRKEVYHMDVLKFEIIQKHSLVEEN